MAKNNITLIPKFLTYSSAEVERILSSVSQMESRLAEVIEELNSIKSAQVDQVFLTQSEYDALVEARAVKPDTLYNIYE